MAKSFFRFNTIHDSGKLGAAYKHNFRTDMRYAKNVDKSQSYLNKELCQSKAAKQRDYVQTLKLKKNMLLEYNDKPLRSNGAVAIEVLTKIVDYKPTDNIDIDAWAKSNLEFLEKQFEIDDRIYGKNIISSVLHLDEECGPHMHTMVIPIDENGKFNVTRFIGKRKGFYEMRKEYGEKMEREFGLEKSREGSVTKHQDLKYFYAELNERLDTSKVPRKQETETDKEFEDRNLEFYKQLQGQTEREIQEHIYEEQRLKNEAVDAKRKAENIAKNYEYQIEQMKTESERKIRNYNKLVEKYGEGKEETLLSKLERQECVTLYDASKRTFELSSAVAEAADYIEELYGTAAFRISDFEFEENQDSYREHTLEIV